MELDKALPYLHEAESACNSITKKEPVEPESLTCGSGFLYDFVRTAAAPSASNNVLPILASRTLSAPVTQHYPDIWFGIFQDITEIKTNNKPVDIIKLTFDGLQILQSKPVMNVKASMIGPFLILVNSRDRGILPKCGGGWW